MSETPHQDSTPQPLRSIRVLELASVLAGPLAGTALAERGAVVTKVERPPAGDVTRSWKTAREDSSSASSAYYESANGNKQIVWKDLSTSEGKQWLETALRESDVVIQNFKAADLVKFDLKPETLAKRHPHIVHVRLIGFQDDPNRLAYDVVVQAEAGYMHMNGEADGPPLRMPVALMDVLASHQIRMAVMEGLLARQMGMQGFYAEVSLEASGISALVNQASNHLNTRTNPTRNSGIHPNIAPYGETLECSDGFVVLAVGNDRQFEGLCAVLDCPSLSTSDEYKSNHDRVQNREALIGALQQRAQSWEKNDLEKRLRKHGVPAGVVRDMSEIFGASGPGASWIAENESGALRPKAIAYEVRFFGS